MKALILSIMLLFMVGCSTQKEVVIQEKYIKLNITKIEVKKNEKLEGINTSISGDNIIIDEDNYKKLISNFYIMNNRENYLNTIIKYYESEIDKYNEKRE